MTASLHARLGSGARRPFLRSKPAIGMGSRLRRRASPLIEAVMAQLTA